MKRIALAMGSLAVVLAGCTDSGDRYLEGERTHELYGPLTNGYRLNTFNLEHEWYVVRVPSAREVAFFRRISNTWLPGIDFAHAKPQSIVDFLMDASVQHAPEWVSDPAPVPIVLDLQRIKNAGRKADGRLVFTENGKQLHATMPETVSVYRRTTDLWWAVKVLAHEAAMTARIEDGRIVLEPKVFVQGPAADTEAAKGVSHEPAR